MQAALDYLLPGNTSIDTQFDVEALVNADSDYPVTFYGSVDTSKAGVPIKNYEYFKPKMRTGFAPKRQNHLMTTIAAVYKRNMVNAHFAFPTDYEARAREAIEFAFDTLCVKDWRQKLEVRRKTPITVNERVVNEWAEAQTPEKIRRLEKELDGKLLIDMDISEFQLFLKPFNKTPTDTKIQEEVQQPQTVVYHPVTLNAHFGPVFREVEESFLSILKPNVLYNKKKNLDEIEEFINDVDTNAPERDCRYVENDFSAYDKSQHIETWYLEKVVYEMLGLDPYLLEVWMDAHWMTKVRSPAVGLTMYIMFQRKSGDVTTSFGNTLVNMISFVYCCQIRSFIYALFLGDDSLMKMYKNMVSYENLGAGPRRLVDTFNLLSKVFIYRWGYFCGYIIAKTGKKNRLISDCVRRAVKLGRADITKESDFKEHWNSFRDVTRNYDDEILIDEATLAIAERYEVGDVCGIPLLYRSLASLGRSFKEFRGMWDDSLSSTSF